MAKFSDRVTFLLIWIDGPYPASREVDVVF